MGSFYHDLKFGFRQLLKRPLLTLAISFSLAVGIGANSAVFSIVDAILYRPMSVPKSERLVSIYTSDYSGPQYGASSYADFVDFRSKTDVFEDLTAFTEISTTMRSDNQWDRAFGLMVNGNYFDLFGIKAAYGRTFQPEDDQPGANPTFLVSHNLWKKRFGADPSIIGKTVFLNNNSFTIIGVTPENFNGTDLGRGPEIFVPMRMSSLIGFEQALATNRGTRQFSVIGRLKPGVDVATAQASLAMLSRQLTDAYPNEWKNRDDHPRQISVIGETYARVPPQARGILTGLAGLFTVLVVLVLLIACSNVSNMLLARATARQKEMAVRTALGASRKRLVRQLLTESLQLSVFGSVLGILIAPPCISLLVASLMPPSTTAIPISIGLNQRVIILTLAVGLLTGLIFGLVPALYASKTDLSLAMKEDMPSVKTGPRRFGLRNLLVMTQIAVSLLLLIVAGLIMRSLQKAQQVDLGYNINNVITIRPDGEFLEGRDTARQLGFFNQVLERVRALPGVESASFADMVPSGGGFRRTTIRVEDYTPKANEDMDPLFGVVATDYFKTMGMTVLAGREFTEQDREGSPRAAVINQTMARRYWPGQSALGKKIIPVGSERGPIEIVGIVKDAVAYIHQKSPTPFVYLPMQQNPVPGMTLHVRTQGDAMAIVPSVRHAVDQIGTGVILGDVRTLADFMDQSLLMLRFASILTAVFGILALALALMGVFSVINYSTTRRTREIGIRLSLGAQRLDILRMVMKEGLLIVGVGVAVGLLMAFIAAQLIASLFGNSGADFSVYLTLPVLLTAIAMLACFIPAYKATKIEVTDALRYE